MGVVKVFLDKISNLRDEDGIGKSDPYVTFHLEQDNYFLDKNYGKKKSSKKKNDLNPKYGEEFEFTGVGSADNLYLHVKVFDDDVGFDDELGACKIDLRKLAPDNPIEVEQVIDHKKDGGWFSKKAKIFLKVTLAEE